MVNSDVSASRKFMIAFDLLLVAAAFFVGYAIRNSIHHLYPLEDYIGLLPIVLMIWGLLLSYYFGHAHSLRVENIPEVLFKVFKTALYGFVIFGNAVYIFKIGSISRSLMIFIFSLSAVFVGLAK